MDLSRAFILCMLLYCGASEIYLPCEKGEFVQQEGCTCWNPQDPMISCTSLGLTSVPNVTKVNTLNLQGNDISYVSLKSFPRRNGLKKLLLSHNKITSLSYDIFDYIYDSLEWLDLSSNQFSEIPDVFSTTYLALKRYPPLANLTFLSLSTNYIHTIESGAFRKLTHLRQLCLDGNPINVISPRAWRTLNNLRHLQISTGGMDVTRIPIKNLGNLTSLSLSDSRPQKLSFMKPWLESFPHLRHLELVRMGLSDEHLLKGSFPDGWKLQLRSLSLSDNVLKTMPWHLLDFPLLQKLDLSNNFLTEVRGNYELPRQLKKVNISNNMITNLNSYLILALPRATNFDFSNNRIEILNWRLSDIDKSMSPRLTLYVGGNPFRCTCGYAWMKVFVNRQLQSRNGHLTLYEINNTFRCGPRGSHSGELIRDIPMNVLHCGSG